jgi:hypothetical protein
LIPSHFVDQLFIALGKAESYFIQSDIELTEKTLFGNPLSLCCETINLGIEVGNLTKIFAGENSLYRIVQYIL